MKMYRLFLSVILMIVSGFIGSVGLAQNDITDLEPIATDNFSSLEIITSLELPSQDLRLPSSLVISPDATKLVAGNGFGQLWYWDLTSGLATVLKSEIDCDCDINLAFVDGRTNVVLFGSTLWNLEAGSIIEVSSENHNDNVIYLFYDQHGKSHGIGLINQSIIDVSTGTILFTIYSGAEVVVNDYTISEDGQYIGVSVQYFYPNASMAFTIYAADINDLEGNRVASAYMGDGLYAYEEVTISPNNQYFAYSVLNRNVYVQAITDVQNDDRAYIDTTIESGHLLFSQDNNLVFVGNESGLWIYNIEGQTTALLYERSMSNLISYNNIMILGVEENGDILFFGVRT